MAPAPGPAIDKVTFRRRYLPAAHQRGTRRSTADCEQAPQAGDITFAARVDRARSDRLLSRSDAVDGHNACSRCDPYLECPVRHAPSRVDSQPAATCDP